MVQPEWLDALDPEDPAAQANRRDLRCLNRVFRTEKWFVNSLRRYVRPGDRILEVGAGEGLLALGLRWRGFWVDALDPVPPPPAWSGAGLWHQAKLENFEGWKEYSVLVGNLILHQMSDSILHALGMKWAHCRVLIFSEPWRHRGFRELYRLFSFLVGMHPVSQHDGRVSIEAGFRDRELPALLGLDGRPWQWKIVHTVHGLYRVIGVRQ